MNLWPVLTICVPFFLALAGGVSSVRARLPFWLVLAPLPGFLAAVTAWDTPPFSIGSLTFRLDVPGAMLLGAGSLVWMAAGAFAATALRGKPNQGRFVLCWLLSLTGSLGVFFAADLWSFLLLFALASLPAYGLVVLDGTPSARRAGAVYTGFALLAEGCLLLGFVLLALGGPEVSLGISSGVAALPVSPWKPLTLALIVVGFAMKIGLVPGHFWLPLAHPAAPAAGSAVLSGVIIKSGVIGLIRFLPLDTPLPDWGVGLALAGLVTALYAVVIGITQQNPKTILAYSSVSQMGVIAAMLGMGLSSGDQSVGWDAAFYAMHHALAKGALFLAVGVVAVAGLSRRWLVFWPSAFLALGMAGLPFTGGALAKIAAKNVLGSGLAGTFATISAVGTALLMLHFLRRLLVLSRETPKRVPPAGLLGPFLGLAVTGFLVRWAVYLAADVGGLAEPFSRGAFWDSLWPVALGGVLALGLWRWENRLPKIPAGDIVVAGPGCVRVLKWLGAGLEKWESPLRFWPVACLALLGVAIVLGVLLRF